MMISGLSSWTIIISTGSYNTYWVGFEANSFAHATSPPHSKAERGTYFLPVTLFSRKEGGKE